MLHVQRLLHSIVVAIRDTFAGYTWRTPSEAWEQTLIDLGYCTDCHGRSSWHWNTNNSCLMALGFFLLGGWLTMLAVTIMLTPSKVISLEDLLLLPLLALFPLCILVSLVNALVWCLRQIIRHYREHNRLMRA